MGCGGWAVEYVPSVPPGFTTDVVNMDVCLCSAWVCLCMYQGVFCGTVCVEVCVYV